MENKADLPVAPVERLIRKAGAERVSPDAAQALGDVLEEFAINLAQKATQLARHAGRKTVTSQDIKLAARQ